MIAGVPVVSMSFGCSCRFLYGEDAVLLKRRGRTRSAVAHKIDKPLVDLSEGALFKRTTAVLAVSLFRTRTRNCTMVRIYNPLGNLVMKPPLADVTLAIAMWSLGGHKPERGLLFGSVWEKEPLADTRLPIVCCF